MNLKKVLDVLKKDFDSESIEYALIGGLALGGLGYSRFTNDIDLLVHEDDCEKLKKLMLAKGYSVFSENREFIQFQGLCDVDIQIARRPLSKQMLIDAIRVPALSVKCLRAEDIIGLKIQAYSNNPKREFKEKADIQALIEIHDRSLNWSRVKSYADVFNQWSEIEAIRKKLSHV